MKAQRDHGGNLDAALDRYGGAPNAWLDLSTGINPNPYPLPEIPARAWAALPPAQDLSRLCETAANVYGTPARVIAMNGAQGAIQLVPLLRAPGHARVLSPTYNEHAAALRACGWRVDEVQTVEALTGADLAVVVNPNNPDGRRTTSDQLDALADQVGLLVIDESFADPEPALSFAPRLEQDNIVVLRSFGKFYGLAGLRLGFALANGAIADGLAEQAGPWPVSGPAIEIACHAFMDDAWQSQAMEALQNGSTRLDEMANSVGWGLVGGTSLFRTYAAPNAKAAQESLAARRVWSRVFPYSDTWIRLGLAGTDAAWTHLARAMEAVRP
ncbi:threonine-phosphate decarboxylase [Rhodobacteraceae bacterium 63075]|nr:threonine-phosphate decarboxylase [Rhodobacteraceae bacterium 63075]